MRAQAQHFFPQISSCNFVQQHLISPVPSTLSNPIADARLRRRLASRIARTPSPPHWRHMPPSLAWITWHVCSSKVDHAVVAPAKTIAADRTLKPTAAGRTLKPTAAGRTRSTINDRRSGPGLVIPWISAVPRHLCSPHANSFNLRPLVYGTQIGGSVGARCRERGVSPELDSPGVPT